MSKCITHSEFSRRGGASRSKSKLAAVTINAKKARLALARKLKAKKNGAT